MAVLTRKRRRQIDGGGDPPAVSSAVSRESERERDGAARGAGRTEKRSSAAAAGGGAGKPPAPVETSSNDDSMGNNDDVARAKTARRCARRWGALFAARDRRRATLAAAGRRAPPDPDPNGDGDPFDCSDLVVPPPHVLVEREVEGGIRRWEELASRVVLEEDGPAVVSLGNAADGKDGSGGSTAPLRNDELLLDAKIRGNRRNQRLLPYDFDYACSRGPPGLSAGDGDGEDGEKGGGGRHRPRVLSLSDPTKTLPYEEELWRVFKSVRTSGELERIYALGDVTKDAGSGHDNSVDDVTHGCQHTLGVKNGLKEGFARYSRMDAHSLGRLRIRDRHADPSGGTERRSSAADDAARDKGAYDSGSEGADDASNELPTTIQFEILRHSQNLKRGSGPDGNRMEVELQGSQHTLLDLHRLLAESALGRDAYKKESDGGETVRAGVFFIENTFYTCGQVGESAAGAIRRWLDGREDRLVGDESEGSDSKKEEETLAEMEVRIGARITQRRYLLGLSTCQDAIPMSEARLEDLPLRLGVRYFHMLVPPPAPLCLRPNDLWSLANESAVFVTGIRTHIDASAVDSRCKRAERTKAPIVVHDTWAAPQRHFCLACNHSLASVVTVDDPLTDAASPALDRNRDRVHLQGVAMCSSCYRALHYKPNHQRGEEGHSQPLLELWSKHRASLVFPIEDYQRMATASYLDDISKNVAF